MLKIKLQRIGKKAQAQYRIVVREDRVKQGGSYNAEIGYYNPGTNPATVRLDTKAYADWMKKGAQPTQTVRALANKLNPKSK